MATFQKIIVNGKEINPQDMQSLPESVQQVLADKNNDGVPDFIAGLFNNPIVQKAMGGATDFSQLPPETQAKLQQLVGKVTGVQTVPSHESSAPQSTGSTWRQPLAKPIDWNQITSPEQPKPVSIKVVIFATMAIFSLLVFAFAIFYFFRH